MYPESKIYEFINESLFHGKQRETIGMASTCVNNLFLINGKIQPQLLQPWLVLREKDK